jgi:hypothetical protein
MLDLNFGRKVSIMIIFYREVHFTCVLATRTHTDNILHYFNFITKYFYIKNMYLNLRRDRLSTLN